MIIQPGGNTIILLNKLSDMRSTLVVLIAKFVLPWSCEGLIEEKDGVLEYCAAKQPSIHRFLGALLAVDILHILV